MSGASEKMESTIENYRILVTKETPDEKVIIVGDGGFWNNLA